MPDIPLQNPVAVLPAIDRVREGDSRPLWSVMIPVFNCAEYLRKTLQSVLMQDPGPEVMQIEVVDDCSTLDDPKAVVDEVGKGRVIYHRNEVNTGCCTLNFNHCIRRSRGELVHILHGDDWVLPGFYEEVGRLATKHPDAALVGVRSVFVDESGRWEKLTPLLPKFEARTTDGSDFWLHTELQCAGVVVRRSFYEEHGGFREDLVHSADHEMWYRAICRGGAVVSPEVLAAYRVFSGNDTGRLMKSADNLRDRLRLLRILESSDQRFPREAAKRNLLAAGRRQWRRFRTMGDKQAAAANAAFLIEYGGLSEWWKIFKKNVVGG